MAKKITIEGYAEFGETILSCICAFCGQASGENASIEFNFKEQKVFYLCGNKKCKKMNDMQFGKQKPVPYPRIGIGR